MVAQPFDWWDGVSRSFLLNRVEDIDRGCYGLIYILGKSYEIDKKRVQVET